MNLFLKNKVRQEQQKKCIEQNKDHLSFFNKEEAEKFKNDIFRSKQSSNNTTFVVGKFNSNNKLKVETVKLFLSEKDNYQTFIAKNIQTGKETSLNQYNFALFADSVLTRRNQQGEATIFNDHNELLDMLNIKQEQKQDKTKKRRRKP